MVVGESGWLVRSIDRSGLARRWDSCWWEVFAPCIKVHTKGVGTRQIAPRHWFWSVPHRKEEKEQNYKHVQRSFFSDEAWSLPCRRWSKGGVQAAANGGVRFYCLNIFVVPCFVVYFLFLDRRILGMRFSVMGESPGTRWRWRSVQAMGLVCLFWRWSNLGLGGFSFFFCYKEINFRFAKYFYFFHGILRCDPISKVPNCKRQTLKCNTCFANRTRNISSKMFHIFYLIAWHHLYFNNKSNFSNFNFQSYRHCTTASQTERAELWFLFLVSPHYRFKSITMYLLFISFHPKATGKQWFSPVSIQPKPGNKRWE